MQISKIYTSYAINYLVETGEKTILIDCSVSLEKLKKLTNTLDAIVITHGHFDHIFTLKEVSDFYGCKIYMHSNAIPKLSDSRLNASKAFLMPMSVDISAERIVSLFEGKNNIGGVPAEIFYAFGHTNDSVLIKIGNALFVGDFVIGSTFGRTDLPTGDYRKMKANLEKYSTLLKTCTLFCGH